MADGKKTPIEPSMIARAVAGVRYVLSGVTPDLWFGPGQPILPVAPEEVKGRAFDYPVGYNLRQNPRSDENVSFGQLRALADGYDLVRLVIETRKDQMSRLKFTVAPRDKIKKAPDPRCDEVKNFLAFPDREHGWSDWLRMVLEDLLVLDAPAIYARPTVGGGLYALETLDGATIRRVLASDGRTPEAPEPAYQQVIKGLPAVDYSRDELIYKPRNLRTHKVYGYSPVEQIITTVNIALRRQVYQLQYFTEGSIPDLIMQVPADWSADQIKHFGLNWDARLAGNTANRSKAMFVPAGVDPVDTKDKALHDAFDEWLARVVCYAFSISPQAFVKEQNRAQANTAKDVAAEEGLMPVMEWVKNLIDLIIWRYWGYADLEFAWVDERDHDPLQQAQINDIYLKAKVITADEVRADLGRDPLTAAQKEELAPEPVAPPGVALGGIKRTDGNTNDPNPGDDTSKAARAQKKSPYTPLTVTARAS